ncbi:GntR family transcriptional regulator [Psychromonas sp. KJ10-2]|uniref:GntR family transcriptional regulator n=1 Tax=Psychromonas sp. KJ10-2 TaxID=3391822 RepID=UPI0039B5C8E9
METALKLYEKIANTLRENIQTGLFVEGDKLPSIRQLVTEFEVSISTVQQSYHQLEMEGLIEARPKSGYFVAHKMESPSLPLPQDPHSALLKYRNGKMF